MRFMKLAAAVMAAFAAWAAAPAAEAQIKKIKVATEGAYAPWNFVNSQGKLEGFELDLGAELCKRAKFDCEFVAQDWDGIIPSLLARKYDVIMAGMDVTPKRLETINFSVPYAYAPAGFMALKSSPLTKMPGGEYNLSKDLATAEKGIEELKSHLKGKVLGVQVATSYLAFAEKYFKDVAEIREYKTTEQHDLDLAAGRIEAALAALSAFKATMETPTGKDMTIVGPAFSGGMLGLGVAAAMRKEDKDLKEAFDAAINSAIADGAVRRLSEKWFKINMTPKS
jgi:octopine/nopaline transport system substrate-binding protein